VLVGSNSWWQLSQVKGGPLFSMQQLVTGLARIGHFPIRLDGCTYTGIRCTYTRQTGGTDWGTK